MTIMKKTALALRHLAFEDLGRMAPLLRERGSEVRCHEAGVHEFAAAGIPPQALREAAEQQGPGLAEALARFMADRLDQALL